MSYGYPALTAELKAKVFGLNAAALYEIDPAANVIKLIWDDREYRVPFAVKTPEP